MSKYIEDQKYVDYFVDSPRFVKLTIEKQNEREHVDEIREALRIKSASDYLREIK